jgi:trehalose-phosphatase
MNDIDQNPVLRNFFSRLANSRDRSLMLDYDGTLAPFTLRRDQAVPYPGVTEVLDRILEHRITRVVIISGRAVESLIPLLGLANRPEIWGSHGLERLKPDGEYEIIPIEPAASAAIEEAESWAKARASSERLERKPAGLALHTRGMDEGHAKALALEARKMWSEIVLGKGLELHEFDGGIELRIKGISKARAVESIMDECPGTTILAYLGDDLTDEDAFEAIKGRGLSVLVRKEWRDTAADLWLKSYEQMLGFLRQWLETERSGD